MNLKELKQIKLKRGDKKIMKTKIKQEKGITLIALVVTIVVLLILAGVSVNAIFNDNGIIARAQEAQNKMDEAQQKDMDAINNLNSWIDKTVESGDKEKEEVTITLDMNNAGEFILFVEKDGMVNYTTSKTYEIKVEKGKKVVFPTRIPTKVTTSIEWPRTIQDVRENGLIDDGACTLKFPYIAFTGACEDGFSESPNAQLGEGKKEIIAEKDITLYFVND